MSNLWKALRDVSRDVEPPVGFEASAEPVARAARAPDPALFDFIARPDDQPPPPLVIAAGPESQSSRVTLGNGRSAEPTGDGDAVKSRFSSPVRSASPLNRARKEGVQAHANSVAPVSPLQRSNGSDRSSQNRGSRPSGLGTANRNSAHVAGSSAPAVASMRSGSAPGASARPAPETPASTQSGFTPRAAAAHASVRSVTGPAGEALAPQDRAPAGAAASAFAHQASVPTAPAPTFAPQAGEPRAPAFATRGASSAPAFAPPAAPAPAFAPPAAAPAVPVFAPDAGSVAGPPSAVTAPPTGTSAPRVGVIPRPPTPMIPVAGISASRRFVGQPMQPSAAGAAVNALIPNGAVPQRLPTGFDATAAGQWKPSDDDVIPGDSHRSGGRRRGRRR